MSDRDRESPPRLESMSPDKRHSFCREVLANLSDLVEGEAPDELCREVERTLGDCAPYLSFRESFERTIRAVNDLGDRSPVGFDSSGYQRCVEKARQALERGD